MRPSAIAPLLVSGMLAVGCTTTGGGGDTLNVPAGRTTSVATFSIFDRTSCQGGELATARIVQPANGTVRVKPVTRRANAEGFRAGDAKCTGSTFRGQDVLYTPDRGYRGLDRFTVRFSWNERPGSRRTANETYRVNVQ